MTLAAWAAWIVSALLSLFPHWPARARAARRLATARVLVILRACETEHAPPAVCRAAVATCYVESGLRARSHGASLCGCQPYETDDATQARCAVRATLRALSVCESPAEASVRYIDGHCRVPPTASPAWVRHVARHVAEVERVRVHLSQR